MLAASTRTRRLNVTCDSSVDREVFLHYSLIPSLLIILVLSFLQRREHRRQRDDTFYLLGDHFGIIMPLDFVGTFSNRWSYGVAFGATANKVMFLFSEGYQPLKVPQWAQAFVLLLGGMEVGLSYFPFFACLSSEFRLVSSILGFSYSLTWFVLTILQISQCPHGQFIVMEFCVFLLVRDELDIFEDRLQSYLNHMNETGTLTPVILQVKELISVSKGAWVVTIFPASLTCISYLFHILACYRKHIKRLWAGDKDFLPQKFQSPSSAASVVAIARYSGWQIAYILWGYLIIHVVQSLCGVMLMYSLVMPILHHRGLEMLRGLGLGVLTLFVVVGLMILQVWIAGRFFLQPKLGTADKQKPLALHNRRAFHNFNYFLFFYNVLLGLGACLSRLLISCLLGTWLIARIDRTIMQSGYEDADMGFKAWVGMLFVDHYHTNPVLVSFCHILITSHRDRKLQKTMKYWYLNQSAGPRVSARARMRWLLLQTLVNNPRLAVLRKSKSGHGSREFAQILPTCSDC
ncbi:stimulated by retinoic acid gene 6 protein-like isoform X5 [Peromyscus maniculatus bairdii]|uniref:stimulated by retinoic acid gene 6 protein-like isoform X5 n=1 Tax=Peromyscus maniculatus bairdii TaxID=230844 RepID=UPI003FD27405